MKKTKLFFLMIISIFLVTSCSNKNEIENSVTTDNNSETELTDSTANDNIIPNYELKKGEIAPDFEVKILNDNKVKLSDYKGKPVLLNFFTTWCPPCKEEMPDLQKLHEEYNENLTVLTINIGEETTIVEDFINENNYSFLVGLDPQLSIKYPVISLPTTYILDKDGKIVLIQEGVIPSTTMYDYYKPVIDELINN